jgi:hypothetical protein
MGNPFASHTTKVLELPFDPPQTVTIRRLPGRHLEAAGRERVFARMDAIRRMGGPRWQKDLQSAIAQEEQEAAASTVAPEPVVEAAPAPADPLLDYDKQVLVAHGVVAWSYPDPVTPERIADLDADAVDWIAREVLRLTKPALFQTPADVEAAVKND